MPCYRARYKLTTKGEIKLGKLKTGDLVFFSDNWSRSRVTRKIRNINGKLWTSGGVVVYHPELYGPEPHLLEYRDSYEDDLLIDKLTNTQVEKGVRLVSLAERMRQTTYDACMLRRLNTHTSEQVQNTNLTVCSALVKGIRHHTFSNPAHMIYNSLLNTGLLNERGTNGVLLSDCANDAINQHSLNPQLYLKGKIYQLNTELTCPPVA